MMSFFIENTNIRIPHTSTVEACIGKGLIKGEVDYAIINKEKNKGLIIIKIDTRVGAFDLEDFNNGEYTVLNYKEFNTTDEAYDKMMKWMGKMFKKMGTSRYFNKINPYNHKINHNIFNKDLIRKIEIIRSRRP